MSAPEAQRSPGAPSASPGFGQADLSNCEREQIHLAGSIQPHGALLLVREPDLVILQASANAAALLGLEGDLLGRSLDELGGTLALCVRSHLGERIGGEIPVAVRCRVGGLSAELDGSMHRPPAGGLILELEVAGPAVELSAFACDALRTISGSSSLRALCDQTAKIFKNLAGYDRVMVYRFDEDGHGEVFAEEREPQLEPFLGNRYPASDIPQIARRLYERNRVRVLVDVKYQPVPLVPSRCPIDGDELDMSLCCLRSMSPIHIQYLKNMGVCATLVASLLVGGKLWGLVACHHYAPREVHYPTRVLCELLAEAVSTRIATLESFAQSQSELSVRRLEQRMVEAIATNGDWEGALFDNPQVVLQPLRAGGVTLLRDGEAITAGEVPGTQELREIGTWLDAKPRGPVIATPSLGRDDPRFAILTPVAAGLLAVPISRSPGEYLIWFRPERVRTVTWGGNPFKAVEVGDDPTQLSPRRSFAQWHQVVEGTSDPWTPNELATARLMGESVADVIQQFRSVRLLIAQSQLEKIREKVRLSEQPVLIADERGAILLANDAFDQLLAGEPRPRSLDEILPLFVDGQEARLRLRELREEQRPWRGEATLATRSGPGPFLVRADPVLSAPQQPLGFVFIFNDLSERKAAEHARRRFHERILAQRRLLRMPVDTKADLVVRDMMSSLVGNAQLAALEISDNLEVVQVPEMLESVQASVARSAELLEHLIWYADRGAKRGN
jgi:light-regulated signal transduction histidine kinase (bacteriophytochrome)